MGSSEDAGGGGAADRWRSGLVLSQLRGAEEGSESLLWDKIRRDQGIVIDGHAFGSVKYVNSHKVSLIVRSLI